MFGSKIEPELASALAENAGLQLRSPALQEALAASQFRLVHAEAGYRSGDFVGTRDALPRREPSNRPVMGAMDGFPGRMTS